VAHTLPHLTDLDGDRVLPSERISARQENEEIVEVVEEAAMKFREQERIKNEMIKNGVDPFPPKFNEKGERVYGHSPEERIQMLRETEEEQRKKNKPPEPGSISAIHQELNQKPRKLPPQEEFEKYGRYLMKNEGKFPFSFDQDGDTEVVITLNPGKYISTSLINVEVELQYVRITVKDKVAQFPLSVEVSAAGAKVQRSSTTGQVKVTIPLAPHVLQEKKLRRERYASVVPSSLEPPPTDDSLS
jgi:protein TilB